VNADLKEEEKITMGHLFGNKKGEMVAEDSLKFN
jgi:hypothetical protein